MIAASAPDSEPPATPGASPPAGWDALKADGNIQFAPVEIASSPPPEPGWLLRALDRLFALLAELFAPLGQALAGAWWWLQWVLFALVALIALVLLARLLGAPGGARSGRGGAADAAREPWRPDAALSLALLEDADRLAAAGQYDEATHLLLKRSVGHIATAQPGAVEPSSTARELAALPVLPEAARAAFGVIAERVERSLFALSALERADWEAARSAYAEFALVGLDSRRPDA